jgi:superfamily II DNA helicase RecQ
MWWEQDKSESTGRNRGVALSRGRRLKPNSKPELARRFRTMIALKETLESDFVERVRSIFSETGLLAKAKNFEYRPEQQEMAVAVARALETEQHLVVEAGTGVGKSIAYLIPSCCMRSSSTRKPSSRRRQSTSRSSCSTRTSRS